MDEVLSFGNLRLIRDARIRTGLLDLYATYERIAIIEAHMYRDFGAYLYDPTFSVVPLRFQGPWPDTPENRRHVEALLGDVRIENGFRLLVVNLESTGNLRLIADPTLRQRVAGRYTSDEGQVARLSASADRVGSGLYHLMAGYEGRYGLSGGGIPSETSDQAAGFLREVLSDPAFEAELGRELRRHAIALFYLKGLQRALEDYLRVINEAQ